MAKGVAQRPAVQHHADDVRGAVVRADVRDREDVGVIQRGGGSCFLVEAPQTVGICRVRGRKNLDRDIAPEPLVARRVDLAYPAPAQQGQDFVRADSGADVRAIVNRVHELTVEAGAAAGSFPTTESPRVVRTCKEHRAQRTTLSEEVPWMVEVRNLRKHFGALAAVNAISFDAPDGVITGLLGENGAGKTTTLAMICGLMQPDEGTIQVGAPYSVLARPRPYSPAFGRFAPRAGRRRSATLLERRRQIGALLDHKGLYGRLTARENVAYFGELHGMAGTVLNQRVEDVLVQLGLTQIADRRTAGFSQGERMKVALGRAIVHSPRHLLLDEPTNGLDIPAVHALRDVLRRMRDAGACIIFSSHVLDEVRALCDNVVIISHGRVVANGSERDICRQTGCATLERAFVTLTASREMAS